MTQNQLVTVDFHDQSIVAILHDGKLHVALKPLVENIGLQWEAQYKRLQRNLVLKSTMSVMDMVAEDGKTREMLCLPLSMLNGWLFGVDVNRVREEIRPKLISYQRECFDVLWQYWNDGLAINPRALYSVNPGDVLTKEEADTLRQMVEGMAKKLSADTKVQGKFILQAWSKLKSHFKVSYREIPRQELTEAISIINRHTVEWELVDEAPQQPQQDQEIDVAALLLSGQCDPKPLTAAQHMLIDQCAGRLVGEAYPLIRAHLERRVAWNSNAAQQNSAEATQAILGGATLGNCLAHHYRNELQAAHTVMQVVRQRLDAALGSIIQPLGLSH